MANETYKSINVKAFLYFIDFLFSSGCMLRIAVWWHSLFSFGCVQACLLQSLMIWIKNQIFFNDCYPERHPEWHQHEQQTQRRCNGNITSLSLLIVWRRRNVAVKSVVVVPSRICVWKMPIRWQLECYSACKVQYENILFTNKVKSH